MKFRWKSLRHMLVTVLAAQALVFLLACAVLQVRAIGDGEAALRATQAEKERVSSHLIALAQEPGRRMILDYGYWDELYNFAIHRDPTWGKENLDAGLTSFDLDSVWVFSKDGKLVYHSSRAQSPNRHVPPVSGPSLDRDLPVGRAQLDGFVDINGKLTSYCATRLHKTSDPDLTSGFSGYLVVAKTWDESKLGQLRELIGSQLAYYPNTRVADIPKNGPAGTYAFNLPVHDHNRRPVGFIHISGRNGAVARIAETAIATGATLALFCFVLLGGTALLIFRRVERPIAKISRAIHEGNPALIQKICTGTDEIAQLARVSQQFFDQQHELKTLNKSLEKRVQLRTRELEASYDAVILGWSRAMDSKDRETEGHTQRVARMALEIGNTMGLSEEDLQQLYRGALLHDIGKIGIPDAILLKPGKLTDEEMEIMKSHTTLAYEMLKDIGFLRPCLSIPLYHHEKWDGTGYPHGIEGRAIPQLARIFAVADVWDALRSDRPYRKSWTEQKTREYIAEQSGTHFDPEVVQAFLQTPVLAHPSDDHPQSDSFLRVA